MRKRVREDERNSMLLLNMCSLFIEEEVQLQMWRWQTLCLYHHKNIKVNMRLINQLYTNPDVIDNQ